MILFKKISKTEKFLFEGFILLEVGEYALMGLYSKRVRNEKKRKLHYLPVLIVKFI